jgi:hypothetical protein
MHDDPHRYRIVPMGSGPVPSRISVSSGALGGVLI